MSASQSRQILRFIPAGAGNALDQTRDAKSGVGSSPRARGTHVSARASGRLVERFIPAGAGTPKVQTPLG